MSTQETSATRPAWGITEIVLGVISYGLVFIVVVIAAQVFRSLNVDVTPALRAIINSAGFLILEGLLLAPVGVFAVWGPGGSWQQVGFRRVDFWRGCVWPVLYLGFAFMISALWGWVIFTLGWPRQPSVAPLLGDNLVAWGLGFVAICIVAPLAEETFFRGFVLGGLQARIGQRGALIASAAFFALLHLPLSIFPAIFGLGVLLGLLFLRSGSLWPCILLHATFNTVGFTAQVVLAGRGGG